MMPPMRRLARSIRPTVDFVLYRLEMNRNAITRELKRLELQC
jgi:hypothetical protein